MVKRFLALLFLMMAAMGMYAQTNAIKQLYRAITDTYETKADSMTNAFIESFMIKNKGIFNVKYNYYQYNIYWQQAHAIDVVIYNYQRHKGIDATLANNYLKYIKLWYRYKANNYEGASAASSTTPNTSTGYKMFENTYTDDMCWITLTLLHIGEATGTSAYSSIAKQVFDNYIIKRAHATEDSTALWLPWKSSADSGPNACTMAPATLIAAKLYQKYGTAKYLEYAKKLYKYTAKNIVKSDGRVEEPPLTYTQGTFGEACRILYHVSDESNTIKNRYKNLAYTYINYAFSSGRCTSSGLLRDEGSSADQSIFKAVLIPYAVNYVLDEKMPQTSSQPYRKNIFDLILKNTKAMWQNLNISRYPIVFCNYFWGSPYTGADSDASMGAMCSGSSLMENTARMCVAIVDRYDIAALYTQCNKFIIAQEYEEETEMVTFSNAMVSAKEIIDNPGNYTHAQIRKAIEDLQAAYQDASDFATGIKTIEPPVQDTEHYYSLDGRRINGKPTVRGIYIKDGRKVLVE